MCRSSILFCIWKHIFKNVCIELLHVDLELKFFSNFSPREHRASKTLQVKRFFKLSPGGIEHQNHYKVSFFQDCLTLKSCIIIHMALIKKVVNTVSTNTLTETIFEKIFFLRCSVWSEKFKNICLFSGLPASWDYVQKFLTSFTFHACLGKKINCFSESSGSCFLETKRIFHFDEVLSNTNAFEVSKIFAISNGFGRFPFLTGHWWTESVVLG